MRISIPRSLRINGKPEIDSPQKAYTHETSVSSQSTEAPGFSVENATSTYWEDRSLFVAHFGRPRLSERIGAQLVPSLPVDACTIARVWRGEGLKLCDRLVGSFSIVVWDTLKREVHLIVDPFGLSSLFFRVEDEKITISTRTLALRGTNELETSALPDVFNLRFLGGRLSLWKGTFQVTPGRATVIDHSGIAREIQVQRFSCSNTKSELDMPKTTAIVTSLLRAAMERRRDEGLSDVAIPLSGGIDSSILAALAVRTFPRCTAFTAQIENFSNPELPRSREVAARLGIPLRVVSVSDVDVIRLYPWLIEHLEEPPRHYNNFVLIRILESIRDTSEIVISGDNAMIFGIGFARSILNFMRKRRLFDHIPRPFLRVASSILQKSNNARLMNIADVMVLSIPELARASMAIRNSDQAMLLLRPYVQSWLPSKEIVDREYSIEHDVQDATLLWTYRTLERMIFRRNARFSEALGIEYWYPLQDASIMEVATYLPEELRLIQETGRSKPILHSICAQLVGHDVANWSKMGFPTPELEWMTGALRPHLESCLADSSPLSQLFDVAALRKLPENTTRQTFWTLMTLLTSLQPTFRTQNQ